MLLLLNVVAMILSFFIGGRGGGGNDVLYFEYICSGTGLDPYYAVPVY